MFLTRRKTRKVLSRWKSIEPGPTWDWLKGLILIWPDLTALRMALRARMAIVEFKGDDKEDNHNQLAGNTDRAEDFFNKDFQIGNPETENCAEGSHKEVEFFEFHEGGVEDEKVADEADESDRQAEDFGQSSFGGGVTVDSGIDVTEAGWGGGEIRIEKVRGEDKANDREDDRGFPKFFHRLAIYGINESYEKVKYRFVDYFRNDSVGGGAGGVVCGVFF